MNTRTEQLCRVGTLLQTVAARVELTAAFRAAAVLFVTVLTVVAAQVSVPLPFTPVPFTLQPMVVLLGGAALGSRLGMSSQVLYLALGIAGLPVFAASPVLPQGFARLLGPTGGYLMSYPIAAFVAGYLAERGFDRRYLDVGRRDGRRPRDHLRLRRRLDGVRARRTLGLSAAIATGLVPFIPADIVKIFLAADGAAGWRWRFLAAAMSQRSQLRSRFDASHDYCPESFSRIRDFAACRSSPDRAARPSRGPVT